MTKTKNSRLLWLALSTLWPAAHAWADDAAGFTGDVGAGVVHATSIVRGTDSKTTAIPYLNFEAGRAFGRIDTFGVRAIPFAAGDVEFVAQVRADGYKVAGLDERDDPIPIGVGTLQITPFGAFGVHALNDLGRSHGWLLQLRYLARFTLGPVTVYPELGVEAQSRRYAGYYAGTTATDAALLGRHHQPDAAVNPYVGLLVEAGLGGHWYLDAYVRHTSLDREITRSPLIDRSHSQSALVALAYRF